MYKSPITTRNCLLATLVVGLGVAPLANATGFALVSNDHDSGPGSLRYALEESRANQIFILPRVDTINIAESLDYNGRSPLTILGTGQTIRTDKNLTLLSINQGADLYLANLSFEGRRNFYSINNRGDLNGQAGKGIFVDVREDQAGTLFVGLRNVSVTGVPNHGIHISDCSLADDCGAGAGGGGNGSDASIVLNVRGVSVQDVGNGKFDADGLRVDDRGEGNIIFRARYSSFNDVGADGVELDEGDAGHVYADIRHSDFSDNGGYCDPHLLGPYLPAQPEGEFAESEKVTEAQIPPAVTGSPDDSCFEREVEFYDSGFVEEYEIGIDVDDGIDFDEAGTGSLIAAMKHSTIGNNLDEGVDFDEEDHGDAWLDLVRTRAFGNADDGFKLSEEDAGSVLADLRRVVSTDNGGKGVVLEEADEGSFFAKVIRTYTANNDDGDDTGIEAVQEDDGAGNLKVRGSNITDGIDTDGVDEL